MTPLTMNGPPHCSRSHARSAQLGGGVASHSPYTPKNVGAGCPGAAMFGTVRSGSPPDRSHWLTYPGRVRPSGASRSRARRSIFSGMAGLPQSRPLENDQSRVTIRARAPAARARSIRCTIASLLPHQ